MLSRKDNRLVLLIFVLAVLGIRAPPAAASVTIRNIPPSPHFAPAGTPLPDLAAAIRLATDEQGWHIISETPGVMLATLHVRSHQATVIIRFDESNFWIDYQDSVNLDYNQNALRKTKTRREINGPRIHRNYNIWVDRLAKKIAIYTRTPPKANLIDRAQPGNLILIADELEKLDALRERGVLTQKEFDQQKAKLLAH